MKSLMEHLRAEIQLSFFMDDRKIDLSMILIIILTYDKIVEYNKLVIKQKAEAVEAYVGLLE